MIGQISYNITPLSPSDTPISGGEFFIQRFIAPHFVHLSELNAFLLPQAAHCHVLADINASVFSRIASRCSRIAAITRSSTNTTIPPNMILAPVAARSTVNSITVPAKSDRIRRTVEIILTVDDFIKLTSVYILFLHTSQLQFFDVMVILQSVFPHETSADGEYSMVKSSLNVHLSPFSSAKIELFI